MADVDQAITTAIEYLKKRFSGREYRLEEVVSNDDHGFDITVSFTPEGVQHELVTPLGGNAVTDAYRGRRAVIGIDPHRAYKVVNITPDGQVRAVTMRQIVVG